MGWQPNLEVAAARGYLIQADWDLGQAQRVALELLTDSIVETAIVAPVGDESLNQRPKSVDAGADAETRRHGDAEIPASSSSSSPSPLLVHVLPKPGVMDPVAQSVMSAIEDFGLKAEVVRTLKKFWIGGLAPDRIATLGAKSWPTTPSSR